jgi:hypothetical protein
MKKKNEVRYYENMLINPLVIVLGANLYLHDKD